MLVIFYGDGSGMGGITAILSSTGAPLSGKGTEMAVLRQIAQLGQPVLRQKAEAVAEPADPKVQAIIDDMLATVAEVSGAGLAAPQIFESLALFVVTSAPSGRYPDAPYREPMVVINPEIVRASREIENGWEGCLSIPGLRGLVPRHSRISVRYLNRRGDVCEEELEGFPARVFQHEFDHLRGTLFIDRIASTLDLVTEREYFRVQQGKP